MALPHGLQKYQLQIFTLRKPKIGKLVGEAKEICQTRNIWRDVWSANPNKNKVWLYIIKNFSG